MGKLTMLNLVAALILTAFLRISLAINEDTAKESPCLNIPSVDLVDPDATWFSSVEKWYYPLASRLDLYRSAHDILKTDYKSIPEYSLYYDSCLEWGINADGFTLNGFGGKKRFLRTTTIGQGTADFKSEWSQGMVGRAYTTLTDNKTFAFTAACFADNQMSWNVFATTKTLDEATKQQIFAHAKSLGYNEDYFTEIRYDSCRSKNVDALVTSSVRDEVIGNASENNERITTSSFENEVSEKNSQTSRPSEPHLESEYDFIFCNTCKKMCSNAGHKKALIVAKYSNKKLQKFLRYST